MDVVGQVQSVWRYPVKSMRGERLESAFVGFSGVYGDRVYAFRNSAAPAGFPYLTGRELEQMLLYQPKFRHPDKSRCPPNLAEAQHLAPGLTPIYAEPAELVVDIETPAGEVLAIDSPALRDRLRAASAAAEELTLLRSDRALTDCRPVSLISAQMVAALGGEVGEELDQRRFRANIYAVFRSAFAEDAFVGKSLSHLRARARSPLQDDHARSRHWAGEPGGAQGGRPVASGQGRCLLRRACRGDHPPGRPNLAAELGPVLS